MLSSTWFTPAVSIPPNGLPTICSRASLMSMTATTASAWSAKAADYYRRAIDVIRDHPENYDLRFEAIFQKLVARLEVQPDATAG